MVQEKGKTSSGKAKEQHPGLKVRELLKAKRITQRAFAERIDMQPSHLSELISGKRGINEKMAEMLERELGVPKMKWVTMQLQYDLAKAQDLARNDEEHEAERKLLEYNLVYDIKTIFKRLALTKLTKTEQLRFCREELTFATPVLEEGQSGGYFHRSDKVGLDARMIATWSVLAKYEARLLPLPSGKWQQDRCDEMVEKLVKVLHGNRNTLNLVSRTLSEYGVKFCIVPKVPHASIDGFAFYDGEVPCITLTKRFDRIDNFAFALLHEVAHLKYHLKPGKMGKISLVNPDAEKLSRDEIQANEFAANALIPNKLWEEAPVVRLVPQQIERAYRKWASKEDLNPWIVLGRISHCTGIYQFKSDEARNIQ